MVGTWWFPFFSALSAGRSAGHDDVARSLVRGVRCHQGTQTGLDHPDTRNEITGWWFEGQNGCRWWSEPGPRGPRGDSRLTALTAERDLPHRGGARDLVADEQKRLPVGAVLRRDEV